LGKVGGICEINASDLVTETALEFVDRIQLAKNRVQLKAVINAVMNLLVPHKAEGEFRSQLADN
jgi:hypothetical protein